MQELILLVMVADPGCDVHLRRVMLLRSKDDPSSIDKIELGLCMYILKRFLFTIILGLTFCLSIEDGRAIHSIAFEFLVGFELHLLIVMLVKVILQLLHLLFIVLLFFILHEEHKFIITGKYIMICY